jgi:hypothetical protein
MEQSLMRTASGSLLSYYFRTLLISALVIFAITLFAEVNSAGFLSHAALAAPGSAASSGAEATKVSSSTYHWNLSNDGLPLISLPDRVDEGLDLSLTYSMDQFEFPLFQSLYYNQHASKYILMVIPKQEGNWQAAGQHGALSQRAEFINLERVGSDAQFEAKGRAGLRLTGEGLVKSLSTREGTVYTFTTLADGQLHCSQIKDRDGVVIKLEYSEDSSIKTIADGWGRSVSFSYTRDYVSAITQSWGVKSRILRKTWVIADEVNYAHRPVAYAALTGATSAKRIPSNAINPIYTGAMAASDQELATIFGGPGAVAAGNSFEPAKLGKQYPRYRGDLISDDGRLLRGHLSFAMHLYGSDDGTTEMAVYVPLGFTSHSSEPSPTDAVVTFYYPRLGRLTDVTLAVFHVTNFQLVNEQGRIRIGNIGGPGGSVGSYKHSHLEFYHGDTGLPSAATRVQVRIDPATVFASAIARSGSRATRP